MKIFILQEKKYFFSSASICFPLILLFLKKNALYHLTYEKLYVMIIVEKGDFIPFYEKG